MGHHEKVEQVRAFVRQTLIKLGCDEGQGIGESMLIRDGFFCGRRFYTNSLEAIWFVEERELKFTDQNGAVLQVVDLTHELPDSSARRAA